MAPNLLGGAETGRFPGPVRQAGRRPEAVPSGPGQRSRMISRTRKNTPKRCVRPGVAASQGQARKSLSATLPKGGGGGGPRSGCGPRSGRRPSREELESREELDARGVGSDERDVAEQGGHQQGDHDCRHEAGRCSLTRGRVQPRFCGVGAGRRRHGVDPEVRVRGGVDGVQAPCDPLASDLPRTCESWGRSWLRRRGKPFRFARAPFKAAGAGASSVHS